MFRTFSHFDVFFFLLLLYYGFTFYLSDCTESMRIERDQIGEEGQQEGIDKVELLLLSSLYPHRVNLCSFQLSMAEKKSINFHLGCFYV